jgi:hypothetical protein
MNEPLWIRIYRVSFALLAIVALIGKYFRDDDPLNIYLSKFSYQTNAFVAVVFLGGALLAPPVIASARWDLIRGAAVMYMVTVFVVYGFLVNSFDNPFDTTRHWTHTVVHQVIPAAVVLEFVLRPLANQLAWRDAFIWTVYPLLYLGWSMVRGAIDGWYPYDFINPDEAGGWGAVAINVTGITIGFVALGLAIVWVSHLYHRTPELEATAPAYRGPARPA